MDFQDKISRADIRYVPPATPLSEVMAQTISSPENRKLTIEILDNYIK